MLMVLMVNEKAREGVAAWSCVDVDSIKLSHCDFFSFCHSLTIVCALVVGSACFESDPVRFGQFLLRFLKLPFASLPVRERTICTTFLIRCFSSLENPLLRKNLMPLRLSWCMFLSACECRVYDVNMNGLLCSVMSSDCLICTCGSRCR